MSQPAQAEATQLKAPRAVVWKDFLGVNAHFLWFSPEQYREQMQRLRDLGLEWTRIDLHWDRHEPKEGRYRLGELDQLVADLKAQQLKSVFYLVGSAPHATSAPPGSPTPDQYPPRDPRVFAERMAMLAKRYPSVDAWQVWNEPNLPSFWRPHEDPEGYGRLLQVTTQALRQAVPDKPVVMGGMAYYSQMPVKGGLMLESLGKLGVQQLGTIVAYHPYSQTPETDEPGARDFVLRSQQLNATLRGAQVPQIWATEWGWSSYSGPKELQEIIGDQGQADYVLRRLALMSALDYDKVFLFALSDLDSRASARDQHYGLLDLQGKPKPVYLALQRFLKLTGPRLEPADAPTLEATPDDLFSVAWQREDGKHVWLFWSESSAPLHLPQISAAELHDPLAGNQTALSEAGGIRLQAKPSLQMLVW
ncbi:cellulase family glycosylhydrolase [Pseudomonas sp. GOM7]|uniref:cellulase family glycosylhydrolase n=1 Tax=Pseudomonas sp. AA-38 TaxID=3028807 RepID=UPI00227B2A16|nr:MULTISPECIES: cellulase family glycosylhydrolase [unclassified Pseudomonas]WAJ40103.1 cellulase family glycosylhydrolase [Pseudomonas sp. GOM7]